LVVWLDRYDTSAKNYFDALGAPSGAGQLLGLRQYDPDGLQNEEVSGGYQVSLSHNEILSYYRDGCRRLGLRSPPSRETLSRDPQALCDGSAIVTVIPRCTRSGCHVFVGVVR
jgi:hypothetical protein